ncbi:MAG: 2-hydroxyglutaryl-CoA dehydratase, partial [Anaerolineaceae bacterium]|nr:2-hydroxyglutaryl-CoA dehydratase [Anaerolineaceae bacterium]
GGELGGELKVSRDRLRGVVATGYGRGQMAMAERRITEITCHAVGVHAVAPEARSIIDIGGQDSKVIRLDARGRVEDFAMNDKCAAGTGRFLEVIAGRFDMTVDQLGRSVGQKAAPVEISSTCTVFAETEVIGLLGEGHSREAIISGLHLALARRVAAMFEQLSAQPPVAFSGGVALNPAMVTMLQKCLQVPLRVAENPQLTAALGAALLAEG